MKETIGKSKSLKEASSINVWIVTWVSGKS